MAEKLEGEQQHGTFSNKDLCEYMMQFNSPHELHAGIVNGVLEYKHHIMNMIDNIRDLYHEYLFPNLFSSVQIKIEICAAHDTLMRAVIGDENSDAVVSRALDNMHKEMEEMEKEAE